MDTEPVPTTTRPPIRSAAQDDLASLSYEQARDELISVVSRLEAGGATLEESLTLWERGEALAARCQQWLDGARERLSTARTVEGDDAAPGQQHATGPDA
ncbi:exodeoxyribonuclease VII small subunit [Pengzhenrongella sicca]|uniref:Exodeoxyribonuclease 7 small subunit n=1 Tax=Pengzhenrongella sicca TaxID=2819238 RepID=A0A8A4ZGS4_9MICO|nr:exodeoxyribonuclease VII small subunit [Pengzhenrongella sicca]QTE28848.1 exodeoxyribonuclease VII small subunit [Pengzhenrongella sicca]